MSLSHFAFWHEQPFHSAAAVHRSGHTYSHLRGTVPHTLCRVFRLLLWIVCAVPTFPCVSSLGLSLSLALSGWARCFGSWCNLVYCSDCLPLYFYSAVHTLVRLKSYKLTPSLSLVCERQSIVVLVMMHTYLQHWSPVLLQRPHTECRANCLPAKGLALIQALLCHWRALTEQNKLKPADSHQWPLITAMILRD